MRLFRHLTYIDGFFFALMVSSTESYALYFHAKNGLNGMELGFLATFPVLCASFSQLLLPRIVSNKNLGKALLIALFIQLLSLVGIVYTATIDHAFWPLLVSLCLYWTGGQSTGFFWLDYTSHFLPQETYSKYLARRNTFVISMTMIFYLIFSYALKQTLSFQLLFSIGFVARMVSVLLNVYLVYKFKIQTTMPKAKGTPFKNKDLACKELENKDTEDKDLEKKIIYRFFLWGGLLRFSANLCSPLFLLYMINNLKLSTPSYVFLTACPFLGRAIFLNNWEKASKDGRIYYGVQVATIFIAMLPWAWTLSTYFPYLMMLQILSGLFWGGMELTQVLMIQKYSFGNTRRLLGIQQAIFTTLATLGALLGGWLLTRNLSIHLIFDISSIARSLVAIGLIYHLRFFGLSRLSFRDGKSFLFTVLSIRPSPVNTGRTIPF